MRRWRPAAKWSTKVPLMKEERRVCKRRYDPGAGGSSFGGTLSFFGTNEPVAKLRESLSSTVFIVAMCRNRFAFKFVGIGDK